MDGGGAARSSFVRDKKGRQRVIKREKSTALLRFVMNVYGLCVRKVVCRETQGNVIRASGTSDGEGQDETGIVR
jgi:hypothetical protein